MPGFHDAVATGTAVVPIDWVYRFDEIVEVDSAMKSGHAKGNLVTT
jgi:hypothetical protein